MSDRNRMMAYLQITADVQAIAMDLHLCYPDATVRMEAQAWHVAWTIEATFESDSPDRALENVAKRTQDAMESAIRHRMSEQLVPVQRLEISADARNLGVKVRAHVLAGDAS